MQIKSQSTLAGFPILEIRKLLRYGELGIPTVVKLFKITERSAQDVLDELGTQGYIEHHKYYWENTIKGNALSMAVASRPIKRKTADKLISGFMERVKTVNADNYYLYKVVKVVLFGSYLSSKELLGDIDIAMAYKSKCKSKNKRHKLEGCRIDEAMERGRQFKNMVDMLYFPQIEVKRFLRGRSKSLKLHDINDVILLETTTKTIFENDKQII